MRTAPKTLLLFIISCIAFISSKAQIYVVGDTTGRYVYNPEYTFDDAITFLDIDCDDSIDLEFHSYRAHAWGQYSSLTFIRSIGTEASHSNSGILVRYNQGDTIQLDSVIRPGVHYIYGTSPNGWYGENKIDTQFIVFRKIAEPDTHYIFLKISTLQITMTIHQIISECPDFPLEFPTAIGPVSAGNVVFVSPNPFSDELIIQVPAEQECTFRLLDVTGKIILEKRIQHSSTLSTSLLSEGIYFYQIIDRNKNMVAGKLLKG